jgi:hypothetical protein
MLAMKIKETTKLKSRGKCDLLRKRLCDEEINQTQSKIDYKDYVTEIFAGLSWLG